MWRGQNKNEEIRKEEHIRTQTNLKTAEMTSWQRAETMLIIDCANC